MSGCRTVTASSTMEYIAFNQHKFASVIENINKELQVKGEGKVGYFPLFIFCCSTLVKMHCNTFGIPLEYQRNFVLHWDSPGIPIKKQLNNGKSKEIISLTDSGIQMKAFRYQWNSHEKNPLPCVHVIPKEKFQW